MEFEFSDTDLAAHTWEENATRIETADFVALPTGSTEQHSIHLPTFVDSIRAATLTQHLAEKAPAFNLEIAVLPTLPYGESEHHMQYPGTITLSPAVYQDVIVDIGESVARHDAQRLLILNTHGGNRHPLSLAADRLEREIGLPTHFVHWTDFARDHLQETFGENWGHAGEHETSVIELFYPELVRRSNKELQTTTDRQATRAYAYFDEITDQGGLGDPTQSDPSAVESIIETTTEAILEALQSDITPDTGEES